MTKHQRLNLVDVVASTDGDLGELRVRPVCRSRFRNTVHMLACYLTLGFWALATFWLPRLRVWAVYTPCSWHDATSVVVDRALSTEVCALHTLHDGRVYYLYHCQRWFLDLDAGRVSLPPPFYQSLSHQQLHALAPTNQHSHMSEAKRAQLVHEYGDNSIAVDVPSLPRLFFTEVVSPIYIFQLFAMVVWFVDDYYYYAICVLVISVISLTEETLATYRSLQQLHEKTHFQCDVDVILDGGRTATVSSTSLVPGDVIMLTPQMLRDRSGRSRIPCDALLLAGQCVMNESMLTGESVPVLKTALSAVSDPPSAPFSLDSSSQSTLFNGSDVVQIKHDVRMLVLRTGFDTEKGALVRYMLYPKPTSFSFYRDSVRFLLLLFAIATVAVVYTLFSLLRFGAPGKELLLRVLDSYTIVVPPALPLAMTIGTQFAIARLLKFHQIYCIQPNRINQAGKLKLIAFDKTGTLTEDGLDVLGLALVASAVEAASADKSSSGMREGVPSPGSADRLVPEPVQDADDELNATAALTLVVDAPPDALAVLATCHALETLVCARDSDDHAAADDDGGDGDGDQVTSELVGDELDRRMLLSVAGELLHVDDLPREAAAAAAAAGLPGTVQCVRVLGRGIWAIVRRFDFDPRLRRMSVMAMQIAPPSASDQRESAPSFPLGTLFLATKGAHEELAALADHQGMPADLVSRIDTLTHAGQRVIALGARMLPGMSLETAQSISRAEIERDLCISGALVMGNRLKSDTSDVLRDLDAADLRSIMVTGDNELTAAYTARACGLMSPLTCLDHVYVTAVVGDVVMARNTRTSELVPLNELLVAPHLSWQQTLQHVAYGRAAITGLCAGGAQRHHLDPSLSSLTLASLDLSSQALIADVHNLTGTQPLAQLVVTGAAWTLLTRQAQHQQHVAVLMDVLLMRAQVFARMAPDQKAQLIERLISLEYVVGFCGDGANDCGALKASHVGVSLSEAEASIAAPFTSAQFSINCVPTLMREGRAALISSYQMFKFMSLYSLIQLTSVSILYVRNITIGDFQFLVIDLVIILPLALFMSRTAAHASLSRASPPGSLTSPLVLASLIGQVVIQVLFQFMAMDLLAQQPWYVPHAPERGVPPTIVTPECATIFIFANFQYLAVVLAYSESGSFRRPLYTNFLFTASLITGFLVSFALLALPALATSHGPASLLQVYPLPMSYRVELGVLVAINTLVTIVYERVIVGSAVFKAVRRRFKSGPRKAFKRLLRRLDGYDEDDHDVIPPQPPIVTAE